MDRSFLENTITGQVLDMAIPHDGLMEFYLVPLSTDSLAIAFVESLDSKRRGGKNHLHGISTLKEILKNNFSILLNFSHKCINNRIHRILFLRGL